MSAPNGHRAAYPLKVAGVWRATCRCHFWQPIYGQVAWLPAPKKAAS